MPPCCGTYTFYPARRAMSGPLPYCNRTANADTYTLQNADIGQVITVEVMPRYKGIITRDAGAFVSGGTAAVADTD